MDKALPIDLPPGVFGNGTEYESKGRWMRADLIRWYEGYMRPVGGWVRFSQAALSQPVRGLLSWRRNDGLARAAFGTASRLYWTDGSAINDITPYLSPAVISGITTATTGGSLAAATYFYKVTWLNANGETNGSNELSQTTTGSTSTVSFTIAAAPAGTASGRVYRGTATNGENVYYTILATATSFTDTGAASTAGTPPATNTAVILTPGSVDQGAGFGYGTGGYGQQGYGNGRTGVSGVGPASSWQLDSFGDILLGLMNTDGHLFAWDPMASPAQASLVAAAPTGGVGMFVTDERMCVILGANGQPNEISWSNQGDYTNWTVSASTTAGDLQLNSHGQVLAGCRLLGTNLIWTDADVHTFTYEGYPFIYGVKKAGVGCGLIAPKAFASLLDRAYWMGPLGFYMYNGVVQPMRCDVQKLVFDNLNQLQSSKVCCGTNLQYDEVWWFFPSLNSTENDSYVFYNYKLNYWGAGIGVIGRTAWVDREVWGYPIAAGADGNIYEHENGWTAAGVTRVGTIVAVSGPLDNGAGDQVINGNQLVTDTNAGPGAYSIGFLTKYTPNGPETSWGPYPIQVNGSGYTDCRFNGKQMKMNIAQTVDGPWQFGTLRVLATPGGMR